MVTKADGSTDIERAASESLVDAEIAQSYSNLRRTVMDHFDERVWFMTEACMSASVCCLFENTSNCIGLVLVDGPSSEKTTVLDFFEDSPHAYPLDKFTPASFLTQAMNVKEEKREKIDLLSRIPYRVVLIPELGILFNQPRETQLENYGVLARVMDGSGLSNAGAVQGSRSLRGDYVFCLLGATVPLGKSSWALMSRIGSRLLFLRPTPRQGLDSRVRRAEEIMNNQISFKRKSDIVKERVTAHIKLVFSRYSRSADSFPKTVPAQFESFEALLDHCGYVPRSVYWRRQNDDVGVLSFMARLAELIARCRSEVRSSSSITGFQDNSDRAGQEVVMEGVERLASTLRIVAQGHALISGRECIGPDEIPLSAAVGLSSIPEDRRRAVDLLLRDGSPPKETPAGQLNNRELQSVLGCSDKTASNMMRELAALGLGTIVPGSGPKPTCFELSKDYLWLLDMDYHQCFRPWEL